MSISEGIITGLGHSISSFFCVNIMGFVGKGSVKKKRTQFKTQPPRSLWLEGKKRRQNVVEEVTDVETFTIKRLPKDIHDDVVQESPDGILHTEDEHGEWLPSRILRPLPKSPSAVQQHAHPETENPDVHPDLLTNRPLHLLKTQELWGRAISEHLPPPPCGGMLIWDIEKQEQRGLMWRLSLKCTGCHYKTPQHSLYEEVNTNKPGRKPAKSNVQLGVALSHSSIGVSGIIDILLACEIPAPSERGLQQVLNEACDTIVDYNQNDLSRLRQYLAEVNSLRGMKAGAGIRAESDGRFNNSLFSGGGRCVAQPATQASIVMCENQTKRKLIVSAFTANKLCHKCGNKPDVDCHNCSANISLDETIGDEAKWTQKAVEDMTFDPNGPTHIAYLTTDRDSKAFVGARRGQMRPLVHLIDTQHLGKAVHNAVKQASLSKTLLGPQPADKQKKMQIELAKDMKCRAEMEFQHAFRIHQGHTRRMKEHFKDSIDAVMECVQGICGKKCRKNSACSGRVRGRFHWRHRRFTAQRYVPIELTESDKQALKVCLSIRLGKEAVDMQRFNTSTQKSESVHRTFSKTNPRQLTSKRNFPARIHSGINIRNYGLPRSTLLKCQAAGALHTRGTIVARKLAMRERVGEMRKAWTSSHRHRQSRLRCKAALYRAYLRKTAKETYKKDMLAVSKKSVQSEHSYATRRKAEHSYAAM